MKHHEYQIYYGGFKVAIDTLAYCKDCNAIVKTPNHKKQLKINVRSHKK